MSCCFYVYIQGATNQEPVAAASPQDTTLYIVGGSLGFVFLVLLAVVVVVCIVKRRQQVGKEYEPSGTGNNDVKLEPVAHESTSNACKNMDVPNARSLSSIVDCMIENNLYSGTHAIIPQQDSEFPNKDSANFVHYNYNITLHGYNPSKTIRKSRKVKKRLRKEYNA